MPRDFGSYRYYSEVFGEIYPLQDLRADLSLFHRDSALVVLGVINAVVQKAKSTGSLYESQRLLRLRFLDDETNRRIDQLFPTSEGEAPVILWRHHTLVIMRLVLEECTNEEDRLRLDTRDALTRLGLCCFRVSDHLNPPEERDLITDGSPESQMKNLSIQLGVTTLLSNVYDVEDIKRLMARADVLISESFVADAVVRKTGGFRLDSAFRDATGLSLMDFRDIAYAVAGWYIVLHHTDLLSDFSRLAINQLSYLSKTDYDPNLFEEFTHLTLAASDDFVSAISRSEIPLQYAFEGVRDRPFLQLEPDALVCLDLSFFLEKFGAGLQWAIRRSLPDELAQKALATFGYAFEEYVTHLFLRLFPAGRLILSPYTPFPEFRRNDEALDGLYIPAGSPKHLFAFQFKGGFIASNVRYAMNLDAFEQELDRAKKFGIGRKGGVRQLYNFLRRAFPSDWSSREAPGINLDTIEKVTPVLVVQDPFFRAEFSASFLDSRLREFLAPQDGRLAVSERVQVTPLEVIDIDSLEMLIPHVLNEDFRLEQIINAHIADDPERKAAFSRFLKNYLAAGRYPHRMNEDAEERYSSDDGDRRLQRDRETE